MFYLWMCFLGLLGITALSNGSLPGIAGICFLISITLALRNGWNEGVKEAQAKANREFIIEEQERRIRELTLEKLEAEKKN